jgi:hypothetical protein
VDPESYVYVVVIHRLVCSQCSERGCARPAPWKVKHSNASWQQNVPRRCHQCTGSDPDVNDCAGEPVANGAAAFPGGGGSRGGDQRGEGSSRGALGQWVTRSCVEDFRYRLHMLFAAVLTSCGNVGTGLRVVTRAPGPSTPTRPPDVPQQLRHENLWATAPGGVPARFVVIRLPVQLAPRVITESCLPDLGAQVGIGGRSSQRERTRAAGRCADGRVQASKVRMHAREGPDQPHREPARSSAVGVEPGLEARPVRDPAATGRGESTLLDEYSGPRRRN